MLGILFRSSPVALVAYFVLTLVVPNLFSLLASAQPGFADSQAWADASLARSALFDGTLSAEHWAQVGVTAAAWLVLPGLLALRLVRNSEVK